MKRLHLFEFNDMGWFPEVLHRFTTDSLTWGIERFQLYAAALPLVERLLSESGKSQVVDLCSGAGGPWPSLYEQLSKRGLAVKFTLTDLFPNPTAIENIEAKGLSYERRAVDAKQVPVALSGVRTIFTGLHHFGPQDAQLVIEDAVRRGEAFGAFEFTERSLRSVLISLVVPLGMPLSAPFIKPLSMSRIFLTAILPLVPLSNLWDGVVSSLRTYTKKELLSLCEGFDHYHWEAGTTTGRENPISYLIGWPKESAT
jgi:hypothetical protein